MVIEELSTDNLREGVFCAQGKPFGEDMYDQLGAWLDGRRLRGRLARLDSGEVAGFILYYPVEQAPIDIEGEGVYVVQCVHVRKPYQNSGIGRALVESAISDARECGASGLAVEGLREQKPGDLGYIPGLFLQHVGLSPEEDRGPTTLYYVDFGAGARPRYLPPGFQPPEDKAKVRIDLLDCSKCHLTASKRGVVESVMETIGQDRVRVVVHDQNSRDAIVDKGMSSGVFVDRQLTFFGGSPISEDDMMTAIEAAENARSRATDR